MHGYHCTTANNLAISGAVLPRVPACGNTTGGPKKPLVRPLRRRLHAVYHKPAPPPRPCHLRLEVDQGKWGVPRVVEGDREELEQGGRGVWSPCNATPFPLLTSIRFIGVFHALLKLTG